MRNALRFVLLLGIMLSTLPAQTTIAVIDFDARNISAGEVATLTDRFRDELTKKNRYTVLERGKMEEVLKEQGFQQAGCTSDECVVEVGNLIGVEQMVGGSIGKVGNVYSVSARIIDVQTGEIISVTNYDHTGSIGGLLTTGMLQIVRQLISGTTDTVGTRHEGIGSIYITSDPADAKVWIDGIQQTGTTPMILDNQTAGEHEVFVRKDDYSAGQFVEVVEDDITKLDLTLKLGRGKLKVVSNPFEATLIVDGAVKGKTPLIISDLIAGKHSIVVKQYGYYPQRQEVFIKTNQTENIDIVLKYRDRDIGTIEDFDGNVYLTIQIGNQVWMAENLKVTHYRNGDAIPTGYSDSKWSNLSSGAYAVYGDNQTNADTYGYLYNWYAVDDSRNIAPEGWHVPTDDEWKELEMYLGMSQSEADDAGLRGTNEGSKLAGNADLWTDGDLINKVEFGASLFYALPGGYRFSGSGICRDMGDYAVFWSASESGTNGALTRNLNFSNSDVYRYNRSKSYGFSVRCLKD